MLSFAFDFDDTIFDNKSFKQWMFNFQGPKNSAQLTKNYQIAKSEGYFDFWRWLELNDFSSTQKEKMLQEDLRRFIFPDFWQLAKEIEKKNFKLNLVTHGEEKVQRYKIKQSGVEDCFDNIFITMDRTKKDELKKIYQQYHAPVCYIDDRIFVKEEDFDFDISILRMERSSPS